MDLRLDSVDGNERLRVSVVPVRIRADSGGLVISREIEDEE